MNEYTVSMGVVECLPTEPGSPLPPYADSVAHHPSQNRRASALLCSVKNWPSSGTVKHRGVICEESHRPERALTQDGLIPTPMTNLEGEPERPAIKALRLG
jgi:hypothetical protein